MNERIRELAEQANAFARETVEYNRSDDFSEFTDRLYTVSREKFAELIVEECASIFQGVYTDQHRPERIDTRIKKHFGVE